MYPAFTSTSQVSPVGNATLGLLGAAVAGSAGFFLTGWLASYGFYAMILPGALLGLGCGTFIRRRSIPVALCCGVAALALGVFTEWSNFPFARDGRLAFFLQHVQDLPPVRLLMLTLGGLAGFWFALGGPAKALPPSLPAPPEQPKAGEGP